MRTRSPFEKMRCVRNLSEDLMFRVGIVEMSDDQQMAYRTHHIASTVGHWR